METFPVTSNQRIFGFCHFFWSNSFVIYFCQVESVNKHEKDATMTSAEAFHR